MSATTNMRHLLCLALALFLIPHGVEAMVFAPETADIQVMAGESVSMPLIVENTDSAAHNYAASLYSVRFSPETDEPIFSSLSPAISPWVALDSYNFSLSADSQKTLQLTVAPPDTISADSFVIGAVIRELAPVDTASVVSGVSSLVFVTVGAPPISFTLDSIDALPRFVSSLPVDITSIVTNAGERVLQPSGNVVVRNTFGAEVATYDINPLSRRIPTGQTRAYTVTWGEQRTAGNFFQELWHECTNFRIGVFTATLLATPYAGSEAAFGDTTRIVVFPWRLALVFISVVVVYGLVRYRRR